MLPLLLILSAGASEVRRTPVVVAVERAAPWVVSIQTESLSANPFRRGQTLAGAGSGVLIGDGLVLTNPHVVEGADSFAIHAEDGRAWDGHLLGLDSDLDLAVLHIPDADQDSIPLGTSADVMLGETVLAIGNPFDLGQTVTTGVVSQVDREMEIRQGVSQGYIQTDAAINPGNSGGALVNLDGELIGINTAIFRDAEGIGFAIPVDRALKVARDLASYGTVDAPWLGADVGDLSRRDLYGTGVASGVVVTRVYPAGPAEDRLQPYDVLYEVDGRDVLSRADLNAHLAELSPGAKVRVGVVRGGSRVRVTLPTERVPEGLAQALIAEALGVELAARDGVLVVATVTPDGAWAQAGLRAGDMLLAVDGQRVRNTAEIERALTRAKAGHRPSASFTVARGRYRGTLTLTL